MTLSGGCNLQIPNLGEEGAVGGRSGLGHVRYLSRSGPLGSPFRYISISVPEWSRCHFRDHLQINFGTFLDHFGTINFKHLVTLTDIYAAGQSMVGLMLCRVGMFRCLLSAESSFNDRSYKVDHSVASKNAALMRNNDVCIIHYR